MNKYLFILITILALGTAPSAEAQSSSTVCPSGQRLTQNLRTGARNGQYHAYTGKVVNQANILQAHLNRLGFDSGPNDGILGPLSDGAIKRMQTYLGVKADGIVGPLTRAALNNSCGTGGLSQGGTTTTTQAMITLPEGEKDVATSSNPIVASLQNEIARVADVVTDAGIDVSDLDTSIEVNPRLSISRQESTLKKRLTEILEVAENITPSASTSQNSTSTSSSWLNTPPTWPTYSYTFAVISTEPQDEDEMRLRWQIQTDNIHRMDALSSIEYGTTPSLGEGPLDTDYYSLPGFRYAYRSYEITLDNLEPGTTYYYKVTFEQGKTKVYSPLLTFEVPEEEEEEEPGELKAFPSAEGYARSITGGRGGTVAKVTNLNDSGAGSFRSAVSSPNRTVIFEVAGYIDLQSTVNVADNITIAGQTSFRNNGQGITLRKSSSSPFGGAMLSGGQNLIVRYLRLRPGQRQNGDCCGDAWLIYQSQDIIFDHVSGSYSSDEMLDFSGTQNITIQNSLFSEPLSEDNPPSHGKIFMFPNTKNVSFYRTLIANSGQRNPVISPLNNNGSPNYYEYVNNYGFNLGYFGLSVDTNGTTPVYLNVLNNYWHQPSNFSAERRWLMLRALSGSKYYVADNNFDSRYKPTTSGDAWNLITSNITDYGSNFTIPLSTTYRRATPHNTPLITNGVTLIDGLDLWETLKDDFGANLHRDAADLRVINQINANSAPSNAPSPLRENDFGTAYSALNNMSSVPIDSDNDGIPNSWELANGMNPNNANDRNDLNATGYTKLEVYLNSLVD